MEIIVCIKQVPNPDYFSNITIDSLTGTIRREGVPTIINPNDRNAIETGLQIKEKFGGIITVLTMCPPEAKDVLEEALAMGTDKAIHLCDRAFAGADTLATTYTISAAIKRFCNFDLILCGNETIDSGTSQVGPQLAEFLNIPHVTNVGAIDHMDEKELIVVRSLDRGHMKIRVSLPALITVNRSINEPRFPTVANILEVADKQIITFGLNDIGIMREQTGLIGSPTRMASMYESKERRSCTILQGAPGEIVKEAVRKLKQAHVI